MDAGSRDRLRADPRLSGRLAGARLIAPVRGRADIRNFMRVPAGPGWALVGDSGQHKDPLYGQGIGDAVRTARLLAELVPRALGGRQPWPSVLAEFHAYRDLDLVPSFDWMIKGCPRGWRRDELAEFMASVGWSGELSERFVNLFSHGVSAVEFFGTEARERFREEPGRVAASGGAGR